MTKYIFDFDDVLFHNTEKFKKHMYKCFEDIDVSCDVVKQYYREEKNKGFVLRNLVISVIEGEKINSVEPHDLTENIMRECKNFVNNELIEQIKLLDTNDCFIITHGVTEYQLEKIDRTGIKSLFSDIIVIQDTKKWSAEAICKRFKDDQVIFIDDKEKRFADLDFDKHPNLKTVLYVGQESIIEIFGADR